LALIGRFGLREHTFVQCTFPLTRLQIEEKKTKGMCTTIAVTNLPEMQYVSKIGLVRQKKTRYLLKMSCK
jgi:hypothetical protein